MKKIDFLLCIFLQKYSYKEHIMEVKKSALEEYQKYRLSASEYHKKLSERIEKTTTWIENGFEWNQLKMKAKHNIIRNPKYSEKCFSKMTEMKRKSIDSIRKSFEANYEKEEDVKENQIRNSVELKELTVPVLRGMCKERNIKGYSRCRKEKLVVLLKQIPE